MTLQFMSSKAYLVYLTALVGSTNEPKIKSKHWYGILVKSERTLISVLKEDAKKKGFRFDIQQPPNMLVAKNATGNYIIYNYEKQTSNDYIDTNLLKQFDI